MALETHQGVPLSRTSLVRYGGGKGAGEPRCLRHGLRYEPMQAGRLMRGIGLLMGAMLGPSGALCPPAGAVDGARGVQWRQAVNPQVEVFQSGGIRVGGRRGLGRGVG